MERKVCFSLAVICLACVISFAFSGNAQEVATQDVVSENHVVMPLYIDENGEPHYETIVPAEQVEEYRLREFARSDVAKILGIPREKLVCRDGEETKEIKYTNGDGNVVALQIPYEYAKQWESREDTQYYAVEASNDEIVSSLYEQSYAAATEDQKQQLEQLQKSDEWGMVGEYTREILMIMGEISKDAPRLRLEQVEEMCENFQNNRSILITSSEQFEEYAVECLNAIAGAPDFQGGSGVYRYIYYLNEEQTEYIQIMLGRIRYFNILTGENDVIFDFD